MPVEPDDFADDQDSRGWVHPDDRLWRHPSEVAAVGTSAAQPARQRQPNAWAVAGLAGVIGALLTAGLIAAAGGFTTRLQPVRSIERIASPGVGFTAAGKALDSDSIVMVAQRLRPSIVEVQSAGGTTNSSGSGVVFRDDGHILTNHHVVDGAATITVVLADGRKLDANVVGSDPDTDVAVLKVDAPVPAATLGTVTGLRVGQQAIAIGSPLGLSGGPSVTVGVVSALGRAFNAKDGPPLLDMIQTDAPISPGSSGGALVDSVGNVIGITTAIGVTEVGASGLGFATPIDIARDVAEQLLTTGHVVHVWLGVRGEDLDAAMAKTLGVVGGALVREVTDGSPADLAGVKARDVITSLDGKKVASIADVVVSVRTRKVGDQVKVGVWRAGRAQTITVTLKERTS